VLALKKPRGTPGRGPAIAGIVLATLGIMLGALLAIVGSLLNSDTTL
jgi:hypothetical protein